MPTEVSSHFQYISGPRSRPLNTWLNDYVSPGPSGSVGDVIMQTRLKQSSPDMVPVFDPLFSGPLEHLHGSNVQDGQHKSHFMGGGTAQTIDKQWSGNREFKTALGWRHQDLRAPDKRFEPVNVGTPGYDWYNKVAQVFREQHDGDMFLPLPGGFALPQGTLPRGGAFPIPAAFVRGAAPEVDRTVFNDVSSAVPNVVNAARSYRAPEQATGPRPTTREEQALFAQIIDISPNPLETALISPGPSTGSLNTPIGRGQGLRLGFVPPAGSRPPLNNRTQPYNRNQSIYAGRTHRGGAGEAMNTGAPMSISLPDLTSMDLATPMTGLMSAGPGEVRRGSLTIGQPRAERRNHAGRRNSR